MPILGPPATFQKNRLDRELVHIREHETGLYLAPDAGSSSGLGEVIQPEETAMYRLIATTTATFVCIALPYLALQMVGL